MRRFLVVFVALLAFMFACELTPFAQSHFVTPWTDAVASASASLMRTFDTTITTNGNVIASSTSPFAVSIEAGCNGVEATLVLVAAILAFPSPWPHRLRGIVAGVVAVQALNVLRVVSLFYLGRYDRDVFEWAHLYVWQALIMLDVLIVWVVWVRLVPANRGPSAPLAPA
jgi:exosortase H (IPTLxxWG-CTERM-specific)